MSWKSFKCAGVTAAAAAATWASSGQVLNPANGHYYQVVSVPSQISWGDARTAAAGMTYLGFPGHLATITSAAENGFLVTTFGGALLSGKDLGGYQPAGSTEPGGGWTWITGEAWSYSNWDSGEPNNGAGGPTENALQFAWDSSSGTWNDISESVSSGSFNGTPFYTGYVVEFDVPEPVSSVVLGLGGVMLWLCQKRRRR